MFKKNIKKIILFGVMIATLIGASFLTFSKNINKQNFQLNSTNFKNKNINNNLLNQKSKETFDNFPVNTKIRTHVDYVCTPFLFATPFQIPCFIKMEGINKYYHLTTDIVSLGILNYKAYYSYPLGIKRWYDFRVSSVKIVDGGIKLTYYDKITGYKYNPNHIIQVHFIESDGGDIEADRGYNFCNDDFVGDNDKYIKETNKNFLKYKKINSQNDNIVSPFFNETNTYQDIFNLINSKNIISSKDFSKTHQQFHFDEDEIYFYQNGIQKKYTDFLSGSNIGIKIIASPSKKSWLNGETKILKYKIPYFNIYMGIKKQNKFIFSGTLDKITNNKNTYYWKFINGVWNLFTNNITELHIPKSNNIISFDKNGSTTNVVSGKEYLLLKDKNKFEENSQALKWEQNISLTNNISSKLNLKINFEADYIPPNHNNLNSSNNGLFNDDGFYVKPMNHDSSDITNATKMAVDVNGDNKTQYDEVIPTNIVHNPYYIFCNDGKDPSEKIDVYHLKNKKWKSYERFSFPKNKQQGISDDLLMFVSKDKYGNNITQIVKYVNKTENTLKSNNIISKWDLSNPSYTPLLQMSEEQNISENKFQSSTFHQVKNYFNISKTYDKLYSLNKFAVNYDSLESITNKYESNHITFIDIKKDIEQNIKKQVIKQIFDDKKITITKEDIQVAFPDMKDNQNIKTDTPIKFLIKPNGGFKFRNIYNGIFYSKTFNYFNHYNPDTKRLSFIGSSVEQSSRFYFIKNSLENEIKQQLKNINFYDKDLNFKWNYSDNDRIKESRTIEVKISSLSSVYKGEKTINFKIKPYYSLSKFSVDKNELQKISNNIGSKKFKEAKPILNKFIFDKLALQGYDIKYLRITWNIGDQVKVSFGDEINFKIVSTNKVAIRGDYEGKFNYGILPLAQQTKKKIYLYILIILLATIFMLTAFLVFKKFKNNKIKNERIEKGEQNIDIESLQYLKESK